MVMTTECPSVTAWMIALPVTGRRPRGWPGTGAPVSGRGALPSVATWGSASGWSLMAAGLGGWHWRLRSARRPGGGGSIRLAAGHQQAEFLLGDGGRAERDDPALVHDRDAVGQGVDLVEFGGDDQHRYALVPLGNQPFVHELDRADVQSAGRLADDHQLDVPAHLP